MADPARVAAVIGSVADELERWSNAAAQGAEEGHYIHRAAVEEVIKADRLAALATHHAVERGEGVVKVSDLAQQAVAHAEDANAAVAHRLDAVANARSFAHAMLDAWRGELQVAAAWLERARERVRQAELWVRRAQAEVLAARSHVSSAKSALNSCRRDTQRRSCNGEADQLRYAEAALGAAVIDLQRAEHELKLAIEERTRAERRVGVCRAAVTQSQSAVEVVEQATAEAAEARHLTAFARDHAAGAVANAARAADAARTQRVAADNVRRDAGHANDELREAAAHLRAAENSYAAARRLAFDATSEMSQAIRRLQVFDKSSGL